MSALKHHDHVCGGGSDGESFDDIPPIIGLVDQLMTIHLSIVSHGDGRTFDDSSLERLLGHWTLKLSILTMVGYSMMLLLNC